MNTTEARVAPLIGATAAMVASLVATAGIGAVLCDDFDDGLLDPMWAVVEPMPALVSVNETNQRLEFSAVANATATDGLAGYISTAWGLSLDHDFLVRTDWHFTAPAAPTGDIGLEFAVVANGSLPLSQVGDAVSFYAGNDSGGPYTGIEAFVDGATVFGEFDVRGATSGTFYGWYDEAADTLFFSNVGPLDPDPYFINGLQAITGACKARVYLGVFSEGLAPAFVGADVFFDDFCVDAGEILDTADVNCDGTVDVSDLLTLLGTWGPCVPSAACLADVNLDETVDVGDLLIVLADWD